MDFDDFQPGIFHLSLNLNSNSSDLRVRRQKRTIGRSNSRNKDDSDHKANLLEILLRYESLCSDLDDADPAEQGMTLVMMGVYAFHIGKLCVSIEHLERAIKLDCENLTALSCLSCVCSKTTKTQQRAVECKQKIADLLGRSLRGTSDEDLSLRISRCLTDQAYAHIFDIGVASFEEKRKRLLSAIDLYHQALAMTTCLISEDERSTLSFALAKTYFGLDTLLLRTNNDEPSRLPGFDRAIGLLKDVTKSKNNSQSALAWAYLGILLERQTTFETTPMSVHDAGLTGCEPVDCYSKAIELSGKNRSILNNIGKIFLTMNKYELAIGASEMSVQSEPDAAINSTAYHVKARVNIALYMTCLSKCKTASGKMPDRELLESAKEDLEILLKVSPNLILFIEMGQVCYYMGVDAFKESFIIDEENVNSALVYFSKAQECELGATVPQLQLLRGKCLRMKGEERNALECFWKAMELEREGSTNSQPFRYLMETILTWFSNGEMERREGPINAVDSWIRLAQTKYTNETIVNELRALAYSHTQDLLELCKAMIKTRKMALVRLCLTVLPIGNGDCKSMSSNEVNR